MNFLIIQIVPPSLEHSRNRLSRLILVEISKSIRYRHHTHNVTLAPCSVRLVACSI
jgi:hypothetical protein